jgi:flagella basal body P-ring formation protein FlgA
MTIFWHFIKLFGLCITTYIVALSAANADDIQPLESITSAVIDAGKARATKQGYSNVEVEVRPLDSRLRLPLCDRPLSTFPPQGDDALGTISVGVRCSGEKPWTIYARAHISAYKTIPVLSRPLSRHTVITSDDIDIIKQPLQLSNQGIIDDPDQIIGMELIRALNAGSPLRPNLLRPPKVITRGQQVILISGAKGLKVRMQGKAMKDAAAGERVKVTNLSSGQKIEGIANSDGTVTVP